MTEKNPTIVYLTAGAAGMYCGSCLRDNALAAALKRSGCDIHLVPLYTPIRTDETDVSDPEVFFGGINVFLQQKSSLFRHLPKFLDAPLSSRWLLDKVSSGSIDTEARQLGELTISMLRGEHGFQVKEIERLLDWLKSHVKPRIVNLTNMLIAGCVPALKRELGVPVLVTLQGDDLFLEHLEEPFRSEALGLIRSLVAQVDGFVVFNRFYADFMQDYLGLPRDRIHVVPLGLSTQDFTSLAPSTARSRPTLGYLARVCPEKGFHLLLDAFRELRSRQGTEHLELRAAGWLSESDREFFEEQVASLAKWGGDGSFSYLGVLDRQQKLDFFRGIDVLSVPTVYREPKGLFALESMAAGVPVVQPAHGSFPEMVEATGGGLLFRPNDVGDLVETLHGLLIDPQRRAQLGRSGRQTVLERFTADVMAEKTLEVYRGYL